MQKKFRPTWWLKNPHIQSCYAYLFQRRAKVSIDWEQVDLPDGDFVDICWTGKQSSDHIVVLLHGLEGSIHSHYIQMMLQALHPYYKVLVYHFRTCSGRLNRLPRYYHAGDTQDLGYLIELLQQRFQGCRISMVGFSLGGNVLLHYLAKSPKLKINSAIAVSVPFQLDECVKSTPSLRRLLINCVIKIPCLLIMPINVTKPISE